MIGQPLVNDAFERERETHRVELQNLANVIPDILSFNVGADILHLERSFDTGLVAQFKDRAGLDFYTDHPEHQAVVSIGREIAERARKSAPYVRTFVIGLAATIQWYRDNEAWWAPAKDATEAFYATKGQ